jgi:single-strand selective monofunctional uracil DNA glycosylase
MHDSEELLIQAASELASGADELSFTSPKIHTVYNPLDYAWAPHRAFISAYGGGRKRFIFVGMNPGPWGMAQTGVPFGEVSVVRDWLGIEETVGQPGHEHPRRPVHGFACTRSEVSGRRLWGLMRERFGTAEAFFRDHFAVNYCPLVFMEESGKNLTPDKLRKEDRLPLFSICDTHMRKVIETLAPEVVVGIGRFAESQLRPLIDDMSGRFAGLRVTSIPHPSPANPRANSGWAELATGALVEEGIWT